MNLAHTLALIALVLTTALPASAQVERRQQGQLVMENIPEIPADLSARMDQYLNVRSATVQGWLPEGEGLLITTRFSEVSQVHKVEMPMGARQQLTFYDEPIGGVSTRPGHSQFLFSKDEGGSERDRMYLYDLETGQTELLGKDGFIYRANGWSNDGKLLAYTSNERGTPAFDIYTLDPESGESTLLLEVTPQAYWSVADWSADDQKLLVFKYVSANKSGVYLYDREGGELTDLLPEQDGVSLGRPVWNADGTGFFYTTDEGFSFQTLHYYDLKKGKAKALATDVEWDASIAAVSHDRQQAVVSYNAGGQVSAYLLDMATQKLTPMTGMPDGVIYQWSYSPDDSQLAFSLNYARSPGDAYVYDLASKKVTRWTKAEVGGINTDAVPQPELIEVEREGVTVPAFLYEPAGEGPHPVVMIIHGGPEGQYWPVFRSTVAFMTQELGIAVLAPNVRGSSGYGKEYLLMDNGFKREESVKDIGAFLDYIAEQPSLDEDRVCVYGGSYGGYMVLASMVHYNDRLRCGVDVVGISNFVTFLENTEDYRRDLRRPEYGDERDPEMREFLERISPNNQAEKITKPLFVIQGANDPRVPQSEAEQMVAEIRENDGEVWYLLALDEGHGFRKKSNRDFQTKALALFLQRYLLD